MVPVTVLTLIVASASAPSVLVLQPIEEVPEGGNLRVVPIWIGLNEATQLGIALERSKFPRPMTHDLFLDALTNLDARIDHVLINAVSGTTFLSKLVLRQHGRLIELDARPSDAVALAIRQEAPLYMAKEVVEQSSFPYVLRHPTDENEIDEFREFLDEIAPEDFQE